MHFVKTYHELLGFVKDIRYRIMSLGFVMENCL